MRRNLCFLLHTFLFNVEEANAAKEAVNYTRRWHRRLAHMNVRSMETLARRECMKKEEIGSLGFCEACTLGKSHKQKFPKGRHETKGALEYITLLKYLFLS